MSKAQNLNVEQVRSILAEIIKAIAEPDNFSKLNSAKEAAGNEMLKMMQHIFPMIVQIEAEVIKRFGFPAGREGLLQFTQIAREMERIDPEVARMHAEIRSHFLPPVSITSTFDASI